MSVTTATVVSSYPSPSTLKRPSSANPVTDSRNKTHHRQERSVSSATSHRRTSATTQNDVADVREPIDLPKRRRVKSATAVAAKSHQVMTVSADNTPWGSKVWGETSYSTDYPPKKPIVPAKPRPASATRMNNPHPSKMFMQWRIPTRIHPHSRAVQVDPQFLKDIQENFYQDYLADENKTGVAVHEVPITNVAKIPFPGNTTSGLKVTGISLTSKCKDCIKTAAQVVPTFESQEKILQKTLQPASYMAYQQWIQEATEDEKIVLAKMLKAARIEDSRIKKALSEVFTKDSLKHVKEWMHGADQNELLLAIKVIDQLSKKSHRYSSEVSSRKSHMHHCSKRLHRSRTWPKQRPPNYSDNDFGIQGRKLRPHSADKCSHCSLSDMGSIYNALKSNKLKLSYAQAPPKTELWHHKIKPPAAAPRLLNRGAVFGLPHKPRGQHFALHPEWPIA